MLAYPQQVTYVGSVTPELDQPARRLNSGGRLCREPHAALKTLQQVPAPHQRCSCRSAYLYMMQPGAQPLQLLLPRWASRQTCNHIYLPDGNSVAALKIQSGNIMKASKGTTSIAGGHMQRNRDMTSR